MKAILNTDGGARGNPGPAGVGIVLKDERGNVIADGARAIGHATNNVAEYTALIDGLELALEHGVTDLLVNLDSELVVSQMRGDWKIKNAQLRTLAIRAQSLLRRFPSVKLQHVRREHNAEADALANQAMDAAAPDSDPEPDARLWDDV